MKRMMISFALMALLAMVAAETSPEIYVAENGDKYIVVDKEPEHCEPGKKYKVDCNLCSCLAEKDLACTRQKCVPHPVKRDANWGPFWKNGDPCPANKQFYSECNSCQCGPDGKSAVCTLKACIRPAI